MARRVIDCVVKKCQKAYEIYFQRIIMEGQEAVAFTREIDPIIAAFGILGMCNWLSQWYRADGPLSARQIAEMFAQMVDSGLEK